MAKEYIEREAALKCLREVYDGFSAMTPTYYNGYMNAVYHVKNTVPTADVVEVKHGKWIPDDKFPSGKSSTFHCSECYYTRTTSVLYTAEKLSQDDPYCKKCGAKMDGGAENE